MIFFIIIWMFSAGIFLAFYNFEYSKFLKMGGIA